MCVSATDAVAILLQHGKAAVQVLQELMVNSLPLLVGLPTNHIQEF